jgi:predicted N-acetyltransferase YhbS
MHVTRKGLVWFKYGSRLIGIAAAHRQTCIQCFPSQPMSPKTRALSNPVRATLLTDTITLHADDGNHDCQVEALYSRAFGPGRFAKAAARLREGNVCRRDLSVLAFLENSLVGACRLWPVVADNGTEALFLGPIAIDTSLRSVGLGLRLIQACLDQAQNQTIILVGDLSYFGRAGFEIVPDGSVTLPGPVDPKRLLWRLGESHSAKPQGRLSVPRATIPKD